MHGLGKLIFDENQKPIEMFGTIQDITEKKCVQVKLQENEERLNDIIFSLGDWVWEIDENDKFTYSSSQVNNIIGKTTEEIIGKAPFGSMQKDEAKRVSEIFAEIKANKAPIKDIINWHINKEGEKICLLTNGVPIIDKEGNLKGYRGIDKNITEKINIQDALIESEAKFRSIFHSLTNGMIIVIDEKGYVLEWNKGAEINFGYDKHEMLHKPLSMLMPKRYRKMHEKGLAFALKNRTLLHKGETFELFGLHKNGTEFPIELSLGSWERDGKLYFSAIMIDVSSRKEAEKHLLQANSILEDVDSVVLLTNRNGNVIFTTSSIKRLIGFEPSEILGNKWWNATFVDETESNRVKNELISYLRNNSIVRTTNHPRLVKCKDGTLKWFEWHNSKGVDNCIISVGYDITEKKLVEQQLQNTLNNLENLVHARTKELENTLNKLEVSLNKEKELGELKSRFVSTASHQFRTPLTVIQANIGLINMHVDSLNSEFKEKLSKVTSRIQSEVNRMSELMNDVLILGKVNTNRIKPNYKPTNLVAIANEIVSKYNSIQTDGRKINLVIHGKPFNIMLDGNLFEHTISNLISNAFKYSVGYPDPILTLSFEQKQVFISVKDFGIGIPPNDLKHLFQTFFRASNANDFPGTGLGIAIAKEYAELNGGGIRVTSVLNEGSEFTVVLKNS